MCGITGYSGITANSSMIASMVGSIKHRGPDQQAYKIFGSTGIGITRLSIVDIENGNQPISTDDGRYHIVFNGEIYNHSLLAKNLESQGVNLKSRSDTEVVLYLYVKLGANCLKLLRGMFAFCIFDKQDQSLFIARDRIGVKPLYYWFHGKKFLFGSEVKAILKANQFTKKLNDEALFSYLTLRYVTGNSCLIDGVHKLPPGHWIKWNGSEIQLHQYWQPELELGNDEFTPYHQSKFNRLFDEAVELRTMGDVEFGAYLSGGLDSSAVVHSLTKSTSKKIDTFTIGFGWGNDEFDIARKTSKMLGTNHHEIQFSEDDFDDLEKIVWYADEPLGDPISLPTYVLAREARRDVKFVLTGEGADEILGGYFFHRALFYSQIYKKFISSFFHYNLVKPTVRSIPVKLLNLFFSYPGTLPTEGKTRLLNLLELSRSSNTSDLLKVTIELFSEIETRKMVNSEIYPFYQKSYNNLWSNAKNISEWFEAISTIQFTDWLPNNILLRQDKLSMACGLEARVPFLDHKLVEFVNQISVRDKIDVFSNKKLLRNYLKSNKLESIGRIKKKAFYFPMEKYLNSSKVKKLIDDNLSEKRLQYRGIFNYNEIKELCERGKRGDFLAAKQVFSILTLEIWCQQFLD